MTLYENVEGSQGILMFCFRLADNNLILSNLLDKIFNMPITT